MSSSATSADLGLNAAASAARRPDYVNSRYAWLVVAILLFAYTVSFVDRMILSLLVEPIRAHLRIGDTAISLLHGFAFAIFYTFLGLPLGWLADRVRRTLLISIGACLWSLATMSCGLAGSYAALFVSRMLVGVGEASLSPSSLSLISDYFDGPRLSRAMSVYFIGMYAGSGCALLVGGAVIQMLTAADSLSLPLVGALEPWQATFLIVGAVGLVIPVMMLAVREPLRRGLARTQTSPAGAAGTFTLPETLRFLWERRAVYLSHNLGFACLTVLNYGVLGWSPTFLIRQYGLSASQAGVLLGGVVLAAGISGLLYGGWLAGRWIGQGRLDGNLRVGVWAGIGMLPFGVLAAFMPNVWLATAMLAPFIFFGASAAGPAAAALQQVTPNQARGQVAALYFFVINLIGLGAGPTLIALATDYLFRDETRVGFSMGLITAIAAPLAVIILGYGRAPFRRAAEAAKQWQEHTAGHGAYGAEGE